MTLALDFIPNERTKPDSFFIELACYPVDGIPRRRFGVHMPDPFDQALDSSRDVRSKLDT